MVLQSFTGATRCMRGLGGGPARIRGLGRAGQGCQGLSHRVAAASAPVGGAGQRLRYHDRHCYHFYCNYNCKSTVDGIFISPLFTFSPFPTFFLFAKRKPIFPSYFFSCLGGNIKFCYTFLLLSPSLPMCVCVCALL